MYLVFEVLFSAHALNFFGESLMLLDLLTALSFALVILLQRNTAATLRASLVYLDSGATLPRYAFVVILRVACCTRQSNIVH